jgi:uncharacterized membrane protein
VNEALSASVDLGTPLVIVAAVLFALTVLLLLLEVRPGRGAERGARALVLATGLAAALLLLAAVLRPAVVSARTSLLGPRVVILEDTSRSMDLPGFEGDRATTRDASVTALAARGGEARFARLAFGEGAPVTLAPGTAPPRYGGSDLVAALEAVARPIGEHPAAIVVVSDGRLDRPALEGLDGAMTASLAGLGVPVHTIAVASDDPADASVRDVRTTGAAVAHQATSLRIEVGCAGGLACDEIPVRVRELREAAPATELAAGIAKVVDGRAAVELPITLDRAGTRVLEVVLTTPAGDKIPENDRRFLPIDVTRDRVRVLHVAGRPTYDVRALRTWLKADASVDLVAFFILRSQEDDVRAPPDELALIPFPVDELFSEHLPSFDAVVLQDFNAAPYGLTKHLPALARYVERGGGLVMVGGPDSFVPGHYADTPLAEVLPVDLKLPAGDRTLGVDPVVFTPRLTDAGEQSPVLAPMRALLGGELPEVPGTNVVGDARPSALVLLEHPTRRTQSGKAMPVLALGEQGSGRTIALTLDGSHRLLFSAFAANAAGRAHGAFWDALLGWLMRDPRFEPASVELPHGCFAGEATTLRLRPFPGAKGEAEVRVARLGSGEVVNTSPVSLDGDAPRDVALTALEIGGYTATVTLRGEAQPIASMRRDFACERGGEEWADSRPDRARLEAIAKATGGRAVRAGEEASLPLPEATPVTAERHVAPLAPPWVWTVAAAFAIGAHWIVRRRAGLV